MPTRACTADYLQQLGGTQWQVRDQSGGWWSLEHGLTLATRKQAMVKLGQGCGVV